MASESELERLDTKLASALGWHKEKGSADGSGDSIYIKQGRCFYVERKRPNKKQQPNQVRFEAFITQQNGTRYYVLDSHDLSGIQRILLVEEEKNGFNT